MEPVTESIFEQAEQADPDDQDFLYDDGETALLLSDHSSPARRSAPADN
jgi:hypothetical protein